MVAPAPSALTSLGWRTRRPWIRRQVQEALAAAAPERRWLTVGEVAIAAELGSVPSGEVQAVITDLVISGFAEGLRGPRGWGRVRALTRLDPPDLEDAVTQRRRRSEVPGVATEARRTSGTAPAGSAQSVPASQRSFSVTTRVPARRGAGLGSGALLFGAALVIATVVAVLLVRSWSSAAGPSAPSRAEWYQRAAHGYAEGYQDGRPGFGLPYQFTEVTGVPATAPRIALEQGLIQYIQAALFTGYPAQGGILAWARAQFGELPPGPAGDAWLRRVAETYATRSLAGTPGYEITPALQSAGQISPGERNPAALTDGLVRAMRSALFLGTPEPGGVLDWARRTYGDLPRE
jgi:hypothetical protein